jgi:hypothetical protein
MAGRGRPRGADRLGRAQYATITLPFSLTEAPTVAKRMTAALQVLLVGAAVRLLVAQPVWAQSLAEPLRQSPPAPVAPAPEAPAPEAVLPAPVAPIEAAAFAALLRTGTLAELDVACAQVMALEDRPRLRQLQQRLLEVAPWPQSLDEVLANADVLIRCRAPQAALTVLDRYGPAAGPGRVQWLLMQWRAANSALDHRRAALALERLSANQPASLAAQTLPLQRRPDGTVVTRPTLDVLAGHLESRGFQQSAAALLLTAATPGRPRAERMQQAVALLKDLPPEQREELLETALNEAAAAGAWGLVTELLEAQAALPGSRGRERLLRLSPRLDDAYGEWRLRRWNPADPRVQELERQLRAPDPPLDSRGAPPALLPPSRQGLPAATP